MGDPTPRCPSPPPPRSRQHGMGGIKRKESRLIWVVMVVFVNRGLGSSQSALTRAQHPSARRRLWGCGALERSSARGMGPEAAGSDEGGGGMSLGVRAGSWFGRRNPFGLTAPTPARVPSRAPAAGRDRPTDRPSKVAGLRAQERGRRGSWALEFGEGRVGREAGRRQGGGRGAWGGRIRAPQTTGRPSVRAPYCRGSRWVPSPPN